MYVRTILCCLCLMVGLQTQGSPALAQPAGSPEKNEVVLFMESFIKEAVMTLKEKNKQKRFDAFQSIARRYLDMPSISLYLLGRGDFSAADKEKVRRLFEAYIVTLYLSKFDSYGASLQESDFVNQRTFLLYPHRKKSPWNVKMMLHVRAPGKPTQKIELDWRIFPSKEGFKILDVYIEGISLSQTKKEEFASVLKRQGITGLISTLKSLLAAPAA
ncbi:MlaC/ttg2D family ABC transporter substrate-binding protein [Candidatus Hepatobacter penaei]|uniref:MlaC/ttg2D family ABC transporter substrate-binding protein n=1 Tax=Candidatus Hepatobacter penaei TaxID=1274402 RepID=UPI00155A9144|nr:ABC transporter substrate-binding protein [Candidatus Hepatobacter penaei]